MLSIGRLATGGGAADYYLTRVARSADDYYLGRGEAPGRWIGPAAERLGLSGELDADQLRNLLAGKSPTGEDLGLHLRADRRPGFDLTFSAPKGLSLLWAFGPDKVRGAISAAHDRAISGVLEHLSAEACFARRGRDGTELVEAEGFIAAGFRHRTSRAGDPQLHTHVLVPNLVKGADGKWSSPDGRQLYAWAKTAGTLYQSSLRCELSPLRLAWQVRRNGLGELKDIPKQILKAFSKRRTDIENTMEVSGSTTAKAAQRTALATRAGKTDAITDGDVLRQQWEEQLGQIKLPDSEGGVRQAAVWDLIRVLGAGRDGASDVGDVEGVMQVLAGEKGASLDQWEIDEHVAPEMRVMPLTLLASTFSRRDVIAAVARAFDLTPARAVEQADEFLARDQVVRVAADPDGTSDRLRAADGRIVPGTAGDRRYTTVELLAAEKSIVDGAMGRVAQHVGVVSFETVDATLVRYSYLDGEQADGVRALLTSGNGVDVVIGQAGTGKSTMLRAAKDGWEQAGYRVIGTAVAARTAADLEGGTGIASASFTQTLADLKEYGGLTSRHVVVVDEASMVGTRPLEELCRYLNGAGAKLVLVGDNRQLSSIDAGGALRTLSTQLGSDVVRLTTNRRQSGDDQEWERQALVNLREGDVTSAVTAYADHGRVTITDTIDQARSRLIEDWWAVHGGHSTAILAVKRADVSALNEMARARRQAGGELGCEVVLPGGKRFSVGDRVLFEQNQKVPAVTDGGRTRKVQLRNGTFGTVVSVVAPPENPPSTRNDANPDSRLLSETPEIGADGQSERQENPPSTRQDTLFDTSHLMAETQLRPTEEQENPQSANKTNALVESGFQPKGPAASRGGRDPVLIVELDDGSRARLPADYVEQSTSLGYALTVFRSQGITVDHTFGIGGDTLTQEAGYTQLSRGRLSNNLYVAAPENPRWDIGHTETDTAQREGLDVLVDALRRSREQTMASDQLPRFPLPHPDEIDTLYRQHHRLSRWLADEAPVARTAGPDNIDSRLEPAAAPTELDVSAWVQAHRSEIDTWDRVDSQLRRFEYRLGQAATYSQPRHLEDVLGPLPVRVSELERWQTAAGAIEAYRTRWNIGGTEALGPNPQDPDQQIHRQHATSTVEAAGFSADARPTSEPEDHERADPTWNSVDGLGQPDSDASRDQPGRDTYVAAQYGYEYDRDFDGGFGL